MSSAIVGVGIIAIRPQKPDEILVIKEARSDASIGKQAGMLSLPAGHVNSTEPLMDAAMRELYEETGYQGTVQSLIGLYQIKGALGISFLAHVSDLDISFTSNPNEISLIEWKSVWEVLSENALLRPAMKEVILDYQNGIRYPLTLIQNCL